MLAHRQQCSAFEACGSTTVAASGLPQWLAAARPPSGPVAQPRALRQCTNRAPSSTYARGGSCGGRRGDEGGISSRRRVRPPTVVTRPVRSGAADARPREENAAWAAAIAAAGAACGRRSTPSGARARHEAENPLAAHGFAAGRQRWGTSSPTARAAASVRAVYLSATAAPSARRDGLKASAG